MADQWQTIEDANVRRMLQQDADQLAEVYVGNRRVCIAKHQGKLWAFDAKCPHQGGPFAKGFINDSCQIVCPWHRFAFDLESGQSDSGGYFIKTYELKVDGKRLLIKMPKKKFWGLF